MFARIAKAEGTAAFRAEKQRESAQTLWRTIKNPEGRHNTREKERRVTKTCFLRAQRRQLGYVKVSVLSIEVFGKVLEQ